jgi:hypothetical protein
MLTNITKFNSLYLEGSGHADAHGGTAARGSGPAAVAGHDRARRGAHRVREREAYTGRKQEEREGAGSSNHGEAERGGAMAGGGGNTQGGLYLAQPAKLSRAQGVGERGEAVCSLLRAAMDHLQRISPAGGGGERRSEGESAAVLEMEGVRGS